jgi:integrase/recombinase XerC
MELLPPQSTTLSAPPAIDTGRLVESFFQNKSEGTKKAYKQDMKSFMAFVGARTPEEATTHLLGHGQGHANHIALQYKDHLKQQQLAPASINRKLAALKSLCKLGRVVGLVSFRLEVEGYEVSPLRDTRGPGAENVQRLLAQAEKRTDKKGRRDYAMLRLMFDLAMRRGEQLS